MATATFQPFSVNAHLHDHSRLLSPKVELSTVNFPANGEFSRLNFYPSFASTSSSKEYVGHVRSLPNVDGSTKEKVPTPILDMIENPMHLKNLTPKELKQLADDIRSELSFMMSQTQKSFKASLSVVELTVAIHHVFHAPVDKILWDIEDQTYPHKLLTGRRSLVNALSEGNGLGSSTRHRESDFDPFGAGHGCSSISSGLGMAVARDLKGKRDRIVAVISNETTMAGQVYEAMSNAGYLDSNLVVILNDSRHSLQPKLEQTPKTSVNALSSTLSKLQSSKIFRRFREIAKVVHDVDRQKIPVRFAITSAGLVGSDGPTHSGAFDITFMSCLPNMIVMAPSDETELARMVTTAACIDDRPVCFRYPRGAMAKLNPDPCIIEPIEIGKGKILIEGKDIALLGYGSMVQNCLRAHSLLSKLGVDVTVADARFCKPLDINLVRMLCKNHTFLITVEEGSIGGFGAHVAQFISLDGQLDAGIKWRPITLPDNYIEGAVPNDQLALAGLSGNHIAATALSLLGRTRDALLIMC